MIITEDRRETILALEERIEKLENELDLVNEVLNEYENKFVDIENFMKKGKCNES